MIFPAILGCNLKHRLFINVLLELEDSQNHYMKSWVFHKTSIKNHGGCLGYKKGMWFWSPRPKLIPGGNAEDIFFAKEPSSAKMRGAPGSFTLSTPDLLKKRASATALPTSFSPDVLLSSQDFLLVHPRKSTWNLKMKIIFQTSIFGVPCQFSGVQ